MGLVRAGISSKKGVSATQAPPPPHNLPGSASASLSRTKEPFSSFRWAYDDDSFPALSLIYKPKVDMFIAIPFAQTIILCVNELFTEQ